VPIVVERIEGTPPYWSNCYLVRADAGSAAAVAVDPGGEARDVLAALAAAGLRVEGILVTHADVDHVAAVAELARATGAEVFAPAGEADALRRGTTRGGMRFTPYEPEHELSGGETIAVAGLEFEVVAVPGHSPGHLAFCAAGELFSGDLLFAGSVGRTDLEGGDFGALLDSVSGLLARFGPAATVYPGHGEPTTLAAELAHNPFLAKLREA